MTAAAAAGDRMFGEGWGDLQIGCHGTLTGGHTLSDTENQIPILKTYSRASVQARKHFFISSPARWGANTFTKGDSVLGSQHFYLRRQHEPNFENFL